MSDVYTHPDWTDEPDVWEAGANERDDWDQHLRRADEAEQDRLTRDAGERA